MSVASVSRDPNSVTVTDVELILDESVAAAPNDSRGLSMALQGDPEGVVKVTQSDAQSKTFEQVFEAELDNMLRVAFLLLNSQALAEEVVQDSFAKLLARFDEINNPGGFMHRATVNGCHDLQRRRKRERSVVTLIRPGKPTDQTTAPLDDILSELNARQREVVVLRYYLGYSTPEIAQILDIAEGTVRSATHRALKTLGEVLS